MKFSYLISKHPVLSRCFCFFYNIFHFNLKHIRKKNSFRASLSLFKKTKIKIRGINNEITIGPGVRLNRCKILINGNNNIIKIGSLSNLCSVEFCIEDSNNSILIGKNTSIAGKTHLAAIEGTKIEIGDFCLFSSDIHFRTGDSHSLFDLAGNRINSSKDIVIGNYVWIGTRVIVLKGSNIPQYCVVGAGSLVCKSFKEKNSVIAGNPAKIVKTGIVWSEKRI